MVLPEISTLPPLMPTLTGEADSEATPALRRAPDLRLVVVVPLILSMLAYPVWGRLIDRLGRKPVLIIATALVVHGSVAWVFVQGPTGGSAI